MTAESIPLATNYRLPGAARTGIEIGLNIVCRVGRTRSEPERRAMIWCANYARLQGLNADQLAERLRLSKRDIRAALTDPDEDLTRFMASIRVERDIFEAAIKPLVATSPVRLAKEAVAYAVRRPSIVELVGPSRMGKTGGVECEWWKLLDRAVMVECPTGEAERDLHDTLAAALGISSNTGKKMPQVKAQIAACCAPDMISLIIVDEAHRVWPRNPHKCLPKRLEYLRGLYRDGKGASILIVATPQHSASLLLALDNNPRWSPDQWFGRRVPFYTPETMSTQELLQIARFHAPDFDVELLGSLAEQALACEGFAGLIVNTINLARDKAAVAGTPVTLAILEEAQAQMARGSRLEAILKAQAAGVQPTAAPRARKRPAPPLALPATRFNGHGHALAAPVAAGKFNSVRL